MTLPTATKCPLALTIDRQRNWLEAIEFGRVIDCKPQDEYLGINETFAYTLSEPGGEITGFIVQGLDEFDPATLVEIWGEPRFTVPALPLLEASPGELILVAKAAYAGQSTANAEAFQWAVAIDDGHRVEAWQTALSAGDLRAHFGLGYTLWEHRRFAEAYSHLRHYTTLTPRNSWAWCWFGKAAVSIGEHGEARRAFQLAIELEEKEGAEETEARELLAELA